MRKLETTTRLSIAAAGALMVAGCGGSETADTAANDLAGNIVYEEPANDASAMESVANVSELVPVDNVADETDEALPADGETSVESNVTGM